MLVGASGSVSVCFSEVTTVQVLGKGTVPMKHLHVGDRVFTGQKYEAVYAFAHLDKASEADFLQIQLENGNAVEATASHFLFVDGKPAAVRADSIKVGDVLQGTAVTKIDNVRSRGLYAPLTPSGLLTVDGVTASNYISLEKAESHALLGQNFHAFSHLAISPFRLICNNLSSGMCSTYTEAGIPVVLDAAHRSFEWMMELPTFFQALAIMAWLLIATVAWTLECFLLAPVASAVVASLGFFVATNGINMSLRIIPRKVKIV